MCIGGGMQQAASSSTLWSYRRARFLNTQQTKRRNDDDDDGRLCVLTNVVCNNSTPPVSQSSSGLVPRSGRYNHVVGPVFFSVFLMLFDFVLSILFGGSMWSESMPSEEPLLNGGSWVSDKHIINDSLRIHWTICLRDYQVWNGSDWYKYCDFLKRSSGR